MQPEGPPSQIPPTSPPEAPPPQENRAVEAAVTGAAGVVLAGLLLGKKAGLLAGLLGAGARLLSKNGPAAAPAAIPSPPPPAPSATEVPVSVPVARHVEVAVEPPEPLANRAVAPVEEVEILSPESELRAEEPEPAVEPPPAPPKLESALRGIPEPPNGEDDPGFSSTADAAPTADLAANGQVCELPAPLVESAQPPIESIQPAENLAQIAPPQLVEQEFAQPAALEALPEPTPPAQEATAVQESVPTANIAAEAIAAPAVAASGPVGVEQTREAPEIALPPCEAEIAGVAEISIPSPYVESQEARPSEDAGLLVPSFEATPEINDFAELDLDEVLQLSPPVAPTGEEIATPAAAEIALSAMPEPVSTPVAELSEPTPAESGIEFPSAPNLAASVEGETPAMVSTADEITNPPQQITLAPEANERPPEAETIAPVVAETEPTTETTTAFPNEPVAAAEPAPLASPASEATPMAIPTAITAESAPVPQRAESLPEPSATQAPVRIEPPIAPTAPAPIPASAAALAEIAAPLPTETPVPPVEPKKSGMPGQVPAPPSEALGESPFILTPSFRHKSSDRTSFANRTPVGDSPFIVWPAEALPAPSPALQRAFDPDAPPTGTQALPQGGQPVVPQPFVTERRVTPAPRPTGPIIWPKEAMPCPSPALLRAFDPDPDKAETETKRPSQPLTPPIKVHVGQLPTEPTRTARLVAEAAEAGPPSVPPASSPKPSVPEPTPAVPGITPTIPLPTLAVAEPTLADPVATSVPAATSTVPLLELETTESSAEVPTEKIAPTVAPESPPLQATQVLESSMGELVNPTAPAEPTAPPGSQTTILPEEFPPLETIHDRADPHRATEVLPEISMEELWTLSESAEPETNTAVIDLAPGELPFNLTGDATHQTPAQIAEALFQSPFIMMSSLTGEPDPDCPDAAATAPPQAAIELAEGSLAAPADALESIAPAAETTIGADVPVAETIVAEEPLIWPPPPAPPHPAPTQPLTFEPAKSGNTPTPFIFAPTLPPAVAAPAAPPADSPSPLLERRGVKLPQAPPPVSVPLVLTGSRRKPQFPKMAVTLLILAGLGGAGWFYRDKVSAWIAHFKAPERAAENAGRHPGTLPTGPIPAPPSAPANPPAPTTAQTSDVRATPTTPEPNNNASLPQPAPTTVILPTPAPPPRDLTHPTKKALSDPPSAEAAALAGAQGPINFEVRKAKDLPELPAGDEQEPEEKPETEEEIERFEAKRVIKLLLDTTKSDGILPIIHETERLKARVQDYYLPGGPGSASLEYDNIVFDSGARVPGTNRRAYLFRVRSKDRPHGFPVAAEETPTGYKVDWDCFVQCKDRLVQEFWKYPDQKPGTFHVVLQRGHYFGDDMPEIDTYYTFKVHSPNPDETTKYAFVPKGTELSRQLERDLPWDKTAFVIAEFMHVKHIGGTHVELKAIKSWRWRGQREQ